MEDNGNIIYYLILGAIYILSRVFGKKKKKPGAVPPQKRNIAPPTAESEEKAPISFEEILRELSGSKQPKPVPEPAPVPAAAYTTLPEPANKSVREENYSVDEMDQIAVDYEVPKAFGSEYEPQPEIKRKKLTFERDEHFIIKERRTVDYLDNLTDEDGAAKAFVLSEIFARKY
jgi:hypothetical protein